MKAEVRKKILKNTLAVYILIKNGFDNGEIDGFCYEGVTECTKNILNILNDELVEEERNEVRKVWEGNAQQYIK